MSKEGHKLASEVKMDVIDYLEKKIDQIEIEYVFTKAHIQALERHRDTQNNLTERMDKVYEDKRKGATFNFNTNIKDLGERLQKNNGWREGVEAALRGMAKALGIDVTKKGFASPLYFGDFGEKLYYKAEKEAEGEKIEAEVAEAEFPDDPASYYCDGCGGEHTVAEAVGGTHCPQDEEQ